ncbi:MAG: AMP-binding protein [Bacteriovoracaceae bacterium]|nr:AMP-binding protein [Bacteriovoracaceae bacterium]
MNVADQITEAAKKYPFKRSVVACDGKDSFGNYRYVHYTFEQLESRINQFANALTTAGVQKGDKALLFVKPCLDFSALSFALFKIGAVPVLIDPGMGRKPFLNALKSCKPSVMIGIPKAHVLRRLFPSAFKSVKFYFNYGTRSFLGAQSIVQLASGSSSQFNSVAVEKDELGAILFTSGGTGRPKGVEYTHDIFISQTKALKTEFNLTEDDIDCPGFPLFAMFTLSMGMTSCIPDMDPSKPSKANPEALMKVIKDQSVTFAAGSPAIWRRLGQYCDEHDYQLPTMKALVMFGAPISIELHQMFSKALPNGDTFTPYGATESLPVANTSGSVVKNEKASQINKGHGVYVGRPLSSVSVKIIKDTNSVIKDISGIFELGKNEVGEILVSSPTTTKRYYQMQNKTDEAKILDEDRVWHRMGDLGYLDDSGALWFCGRKAHKLEHNGRSFYSVCVEAIFNQHLKLRRSALISKGGRPCLAIELLESSSNKTELHNLKAELQELSEQFEHTKDISEYYLCDAFPVDVRHNIKIDRKKLSQMKLNKL